MSEANRAGEENKTDKVVCTVCPHACRLSPGETGICGARQGEAGGVIPLNYGICTALALDPLTKKPLARFYPESKILSYGSYGCNLRCEFCQNWEIAQVGQDTEDEKSRRELGRYISPEELVKQAVAVKSKGNIGIALTYNEPLVCPEYIMDVAAAINAQALHANEHATKEHPVEGLPDKEPSPEEHTTKETSTERLKLVLVTNGYVMPPIAKEVFAVVDAANIDLKATTQEFYTQVGAPAGLTTVKRTIQIAREAGCHVEITTLVIPGLNDSPEEMHEEAAWLASLDPEIPLHISAFHPAYKMLDRLPTSPSTVYGLAQVAREHLKYVYVGNIENPLYHATR